MGSLKIRYLFGVPNIGDTSLSIFTGGTFIFGVPSTHLHTMARVVLIYNPDPLVVGPVLPNIGLTTALSLLLGGRCRSFILSLIDMVVHGII